MTKAMKTILKLFFAIFALIAAAQPSKAYYFNISHSCFEGSCIESENATWYVDIWNNGKHNLEFIEIELVNSKNHSAFAGLEIPFYPYHDNRGNLISVKVGEHVKVNFTGMIQKANINEELFEYYPCFTTAIYDFYTIARDDKYEQRQCFNINYSMIVYECLSNDQCNSNQFCRFRQCQNLNCTSCQYISNHMCADYTCCSSLQCSFDEKCQNNTCVNLGCSQGQFFSNHTCRDLECTQDEYIINRSCRKLECDFDEFAYNHSCKKLECKQEEFISSHECKLLDCSEDKYIKNHLCIPLECTFDERIQNHTCAKLDCYFFQDTIDHSCINNYDVITRFSLEIIAVLVIVGLLLLDFGKYEKVHPKDKKSKASLQKNPQKTHDSSSFFERLKDLPRSMLSFIKKPFERLILKFRR